MFLDEWPLLSTLKERKKRTRKARREKKKKNERTKGELRYNTHTVLFRTSYFSSSNSGFIHRAVLWSFLVHYFEAFTFG